MGWKYTGGGAELLGVPREDMSDEEFTAHSNAFDKREGVKGGMEKSGLWTKTTKKEDA